MTKKERTKQYALCDLTELESRLEDIEIQEQIDKAELQKAEAKLKQTRKTKREIKKDLKETEELLSVVE